MVNTKLKVVIFDLDGVLIDSEALMRAAFETTYHQILGKKTPPTEAYLEHMGESFPQIMDCLGLPHAFWEPYRQFCQREVARIKLFPESCALLRDLHTLGLRLAILTGKDHKRTIQVLEHFDLNGFFDKVVTSDQLQHSKPNPEGILTILQSFECTSEEAVMIGDAVNDILCAQRAGVMAIAVTWGIKPERVQSLCQPDYIAHDWDALRQILLGRYNDNLTAARKLANDDEH